MLHFRNLPIIYKNDMENYQIRRFEKSLRFKAPCLGRQSRKKTHRVQQQLLIPNSRKCFLELAILNEQRSKYLLFKYNRRGKSAESHNEGTLNVSAQFVMVSLPYFVPKQHQRTMIKKKWKQIIWAVRAILIYKKIVCEQHFFQQLSNLTRRRKVSSPTSGYRSPKKRRINGAAKSQEPNNFTLATKVIGDETNCSKTSRRRSQLSNSRSIYYQDFKQHDQRLTRIRTSSLSQLQLAPLQTSRTIILRKFRK